MTNRDTADETRSRIANTVVGKAKEFAGAITGNDELTEEGRLRQEQAEAQREATGREARADARETEAEEQKQAAVEEGLDAKFQADAEAARDKVDIVAARDKVDIVAARDKVDIVAEQGGIR